eukprot:3370520-Pleurochrysis_carterae.AAC.4
MQTISSVRTALAGSDLPKRFGVENAWLVSYSHEVQSINFTIADLTAVGTRNGGRLALPQDTVRHLLSHKACSAWDLSETCESVVQPQNQVGVATPPIWAVLGEKI